LERISLQLLGFALSENPATGDRVVEMRMVSSLVALEGIKGKLGVYPALECFEILGLASLCWIKVRTGGH
jgi:hypothetical protein